jgi:trimethylamine--corrinoid protein Co-methyltransferase
MGSRPGQAARDFETYKEFIKLTQYFNCIHFAGGYPVEPIDIHPSVRHLDCLYDKLTLTDKVAHAYSARRRAGRGRDGDGAHRRRPDP